MGKIKTKLIKRTGKTLSQKGIKFTENFEENKKILGNEMTSKKVRNQIAGFLVQIKKQEKKKKLELAH